MRAGNSVRVEVGFRGTGRWVGHSYVVQVLTDLPFVAFGEWVAGSVDGWVCYCTVNFQCIMTVCVCV